MNILFSFRYLIFVTVLAAFSTTAQAEEKNEAYAHGNQLVQESCTKCHSDNVYQRKDHFVKSFNALSTQVRRCKDNIGLSWFDNDTNAVIHYLNTKYYKF